MMLTPKQDLMTIECNLLFVYKYNAMQLHEAQRK
jgi:hypothetical protein